MSDLVIGFIGGLVLAIWVGMLAVVFACVPYRMVRRVHLGDPPRVVVSELAPRAHYATAFAWVRDHCNGGASAIEPEAVRYYVVDAFSWTRPGEERHVGEWRKPNVVWLNLFAIDSARDGTHVLRHELLHAVRGRAGHPPGLFARCDSLARAAGWR